MTRKKSVERAWALEPVNHVIEPVKRRVTEDWDHGMPVSCLARMYDLGRDTIERIIWERRRKGPTGGGALIEMRRTA